MNVLRSVQLSKAQYVTVCDCKNSGKCSSMHKELGNDFILLFYYRKNCDWVRLFTFVIREALWLDNIVYFLTREALWLDEIVYLPL